MADDRGVSFHHSAAHGVRIAIGDDAAFRDDIDQQIDLRRREAAEVRGGAPSAHPARAAATPRQGIEGSAVAAVVAEVASRTRSAELMPSDGDEMEALIDRGTGRTVVVTVDI